MELFRLLCAVLQFASAGFGITQTPYVVKPSPIIPNPVRHVAAADGETIVVTFGFVPGRNRTFYREIVRVTDEVGEPVRIQIPATLESTFAGVPRGSDDFVAAGDDWWYVTFDMRDGVPATTFLESDGSRTTHLGPRTEVPLYGANHWYLVALAGEEPRALELTYTPENTAIRELDGSGAVRSWTLPIATNAAPVSTMTAERLPDGRIALFSNEDGLSMLLMSDDGAVETHVLRNVRIAQFDTAIDDAGRIAIVTARKDDGIIEAAILNTANSGNEEWHVLERDARVLGAMREIQVVKVANGFIAAWVDDAGKRIEATEIGERGTGGPVVDVGPASQRNAAAFFALQTEQDELRFWWEDGEYLFERRLPQSLSEFAVIQDFSRRVCGAAETRGRTSRPRIPAELPGQVRLPLP